jgi:lauroyl/myristoyl acyltransferase
MRRRGKRGKVNVSDSQNLPPYLKADKQANGGYMPFKRIFSLNDVCIFLYLFPLRIVSTILPLKIIRHMGSLLGHTYGSLLMNRRKRIREKLTLIFKDSMTREEINVLSYQSMRSAVSAYTDALIANRIGKHDLLKYGSIKGQENVESALSLKKGVILVSGHFCGDVVASRFLRAIGMPILFVTKTKSFDPEKSLLENKYLKPYWSKVFNQFQEDNIFIEDADFGLKIIKHLRENGLVSIKLDAPFSKHLIECSFFGTKYFFPANFLKISFLTGAPIVPMLCTGNSASFEISFERMVELQEVSNKDEFISVNLNKLVKILESQILRYPSHWLFIARNSTQILTN